MRARALLLLVVVALVFSACGCANQKVMQARLMQMAKTHTAEAEYRVGPPDQLVVEVKGYPEYSRNVIVRPDGKITVPSVGDIMVQGLTVPEITAAVTEGLKKELSQPNVTVTLAVAASKAVYVLGEVKTPGLKPYYGDMKLVDAIALAGGLSLYGDWEKVSLTRESLDKPEVYIIDLKKLVESGSAEQNLVLRDGDIIHVPPTPFAKVGYAFDQMLFPFRSLLSGLVTYGGVRTAIE